MPLTSPNLCARLPDAERIDLADIGHLVTLERPQAIVEACRALAARIACRSVADCQRNCRAAPVVPRQWPATAAPRRRMAARLLGGRCPGGRARVPKEYLTTLA